MKRRIALLFVCLSVGLTVQSETFVGLTSATNRLVAGTNEALIISRLGLQSSFQFQMVKDGSIYTTSALLAGPADYVLSAASPTALAGPCELVFTNQALVHFQRIANAAIQTVVLRPAATSNTATISVPAGRQVRVFRPFPTNANGYGTLRLNRGTNTFTFSGGFAHFANEEFSGPIELTFFGPTSGTDSLVCSFVITEEAQLVPQGVAVQSPTGVFQLEVEKSTNLTSWMPAVIQTLREDQKAYYRLRITK